jgi:coniferyl-aldehyde dehydrogenase
MNLRPPVADANADDAAIASLRDAFDAQRAAFATDRSPSLDERRNRLDRLIVMLMTYRERIAEALIHDFGSHPVPASDLIEVLGVVGRAQYAIEHLEEWMQPRARDVDPAMLGTASARIRPQPKGVIGNIVPWNFPFDLALGPMIDMLAAGNRVMIKPSDYTPACAALLHEMVVATFDPSLVHVAVGGVDLARAFASMPWDHLLYTGNASIGRDVMTAAAANLTPVTLELGGKCPALFTPGSVNTANVESVIGTKTIKNGQMCVSVDYALVHRGEVAAFVDEAMSYMRDIAPGYSRSADCTGIISARHLARLEAMLTEAVDRGERVVALEHDGRIDRQTRRMPMYLVVDPSPDLRLAREEVFGPILPVLVYDELDEAIDRINADERPLGLYVFGDSPEEIERVIAGTVSGGVSINACALQASLPSLGFGGVGASGMGRHHGVDGFREFSNERGIVTRGTGDLIAMFYAPYAKAEGLVAAVLAGP